MSLHSAQATQDHGAVGMSVAESKDDSPTLSAGFDIAGGVAAD
jgi:hypothetical protein